MSKLKIGIILFFFNLSIYAQTQQDKVPLLDVLEYLEGQYTYRFNYVFSTIDGVLVSNPPEHLSFEETILFLEKESKLNFSILDNFVTITEKYTYLICGYLKDEGTKQPIAEATVQGKHALVISDQNGFFQFETKTRNESVTIRHLGYKSSKKNITVSKGDTCQVIFLKPNVFKLKQVFLSNYLVEGIDKINDGSFQINIEKFGILPGLIEPDVLQTVQALPGIHSVNETVSNINIRGGSNDENLLLWDGIKMYQSGHFFGLISIFNPKMTNQVSLIKNGTSTQYTDGVSGTIEMKSKDSISDKFKGSVGMNFISLDGFFDVPLSNKSSLQISARKGLSDLYKTPTYNSFFERIKQDSELETTNSIIDDSNVEFEFYDASLRWLYQIDKKNQIRLNFMSVANELDFIENAMVNGVNQSRKSSLIQNSIGGGLFYKRTWSDTFETSLQVYETDYKLKGINANILENQRALQENKISETGLKFKATNKLNQRFSLLNGYQFTETQISNFDDVDNPVYSLYIAQVLRSHDVFSQLKFISTNHKNTITTGVRLNYIPKLDAFIVEPRFSFNKAINKHLNLEILGEFKHQITSQIINLQNDFLGVEKRRWQLSNKTNIPIIKSKQLSVGLQYNKNGWLINGEGYLKRVEGITTQSQGFQNQYLLSQTYGEYDAFGFDFLLRKQFNNLNTWLSYTCMDSYYEFTTLQKDKFHNNFDITNSITLGTTYTLNNFNISAGFNWHTGKPTTSINFDEPVKNGNIQYKNANETRLKDYGRTDLSATYKVYLGKNAKVTFGVSIWNLFDQNNIINSYYRLNENNSLEQLSLSSLGFTPNINVRLDF